MTAEEKENAALERILIACQKHGEDSEWEHQIGDLEDLCRELWRYVPSGDARRKVLRGKVCQEILNDAYGECRDARNQKDVDDQ